MKCHDKGGLISKTKALEPNPHDAPHNGDCVLCHVQHETPENYCAQCHKFDYKVK
ncbi:cytochrome c3 family protein [Turicimonas muris]|uniref:cytochrome c3 family protein n=1 Tax=Turicimonas muris TaxID=1796652 RepID=UPI003313080D